MSGLTLPAGVTVTVRDTEGAEATTPAHTVIWAAGVTTSGLAGALGVEQDGTVIVPEVLRPYMNEEIIRPRKL